MADKRVVIVSAEFTSFVGRGACDTAALPADEILLGFGDIGEPAVSLLTRDDLGERANDDLVVFAIGRAACVRLFNLIPKPQGSWYLPADLRGIGRTVVAVEGDGEAADMLRAARSMELLHRLFTAFGEERMVEVRGATTLSEQDVALVAAAHQIVNEHWQERLTVGSVARRCGLNKSKLTRGFRELYRCTVAEAVSEQRLGRARQLISASDLPISSVGYRCGYTSNASFTRAFARRFGMTPTQLRQQEGRPQAEPAR